ncbi:MAG: TetR/AcrR family transcriptional regulator [Deltaproteobacteria bacterium]|nr:TetR/AcrR family transcriptional regulator [Deltaproteobacteria bacterium]
MAALSPRRVPKKRPGPEGGKRDRNRQEKTNALLQGALSLFLASGIEGVTIDEIACAAGVAKGSFYRYFDDKTALVAALLHPLSQGMREAFSTCDEALRAARSPLDLASAYTNLSLALSTHVGSEKGAVRLYLQESRAPGVGAREPIARLAHDIYRAALVLTEAAHSHGLLRPIDPRVSALAVIGAVERLLFSYLAGDDIGGPDRVARDLISMVLDGLRERGH